MSHPTRHHVSRRVPLPPELRARMAALKTFNAVRYEGAFMGEALGVFGQHLDPRDRAFAHALVGAAVRHAGAVDALLSRWMSRPLDAGSNARAVLHLGLTQMLFLDGVAPHAAVDTTVANTLFLEGTWSAVSANNIARLDAMSIEIVG